MSPSLSTFLSWSSVVSGQFRVKWLERVFLLKPHLNLTTSWRRQKTYRWQNPPLLVPGMVSSHRQPAQQQITNYLGKQAKGATACTPILTASPQQGRKVPPGLPRRRRRQHRNHRPPQSHRQRRQSPTHHHLRHARYRQNNLHPLSRASNARSLGLQRSRA